MLYEHGHPSLNMHNYSNMANNNNKDRTAGIIYETPQEITIESNNLSHSSPLISANSNNNMGPIVLTINFKNILDRQEFINSFIFMKFLTHRKMNEWKDLKKYHRNFERQKQNMLTMLNLNDIPFAITMLKNSNNNYKNEWISNSAPKNHKYSKRKLN